MIEMKDNQRFHMSFPFPNGEKLRHNEIPKLHKHLEVCSLKPDFKISAKEICGNNGFTLINLQFLNPLFFSVFWLVGTSSFT